jgi:hypothetical protein
VAAIELAGMFQFFLSLRWSIQKAYVQVFVMELAAYMRHSKAAARNPSLTPWDGRSGRSGVTSASIFIAFVCCAMTNRTCMVTYVCTVFEGACVYVIIGSHTCIYLDIQI